MKNFKYPKSIIDEISYETNEYPHVIEFIINSKFRFINNMMSEKETPLKDFRDFYFGSWQVLPNYYGMNSEEAEKRYKELRTRTKREKAEDDK